MHSANGAKLRITIVNANGAVEEVKNYINGFTYVDNSLSLFPFSEGRVLYNACTEQSRSGSNSFEYEYWMKDHLGNTRLSFISEESEINISQEDFYYPFGIRIGSNIGGDENKFLWLLTDHKFDFEFHFPTFEENLPEEKVPVEEIQQYEGQ